MENLNAVRDHLLELHRTLLNVERRTYERTHGAMTAGQFLNALVNDAAFAWLRPMTALILELEDAEAAGNLDVATWTNQIREFFRPDAQGNEFQRRYEALLHDHPEISVAHGATMRALRESLRE
jgi:hypothetical protein